MASEHRTEWNLKSIVKVALVSLGVAIVFGSLDRAVAQLSDFFGTMLGILPCVFITASRTLLSVGFSSWSFAPSDLPSALSVWPLHLVIGSIVLGGVFTPRARRNGATIENGEITHCGRVDLTSSHSSRM